MVAGAMSLVNAAVIAALTGSPAVGPGLVVAGSVRSTLGRVVSAVTPVLNCHTYGLARTRFDAGLTAPVIVAVYSVSGARAAAGVNVALLPDASRVTVPAGLVHGAAQATVKLAVPLSGAIGSLKVTASEALTGTPAALSIGVTAVTVGASGTTPVVKCHT